ncbi:YqhA family protein [Pseudomonas profundi]|uniref:YqhA family protein n=1 Tax=Pseudomonas profundi TaxID=1981513 RepID=UPI00123C1506|nr:YqhA family protein [Pseudomonas profundi]
MNSLEKKFEQFLWHSRFLVLIAVLSSLLGSLTLFVVGTMDILQLVMATVNYYLGTGTTDIHEFLVTDIIIAIDIYLIAVVLLIFGLGIYRLFVSPIEASEESGKNHPFNVQSFDELKNKIVRVVILAVIIEFFRAVMDIRFLTPLDIIYLALSVLALAASLFLMGKSHSNHHG